MRPEMVKNSGVALAIGAALLYAVNIPVSKVLLQDVPPTMMAAWLYLGTGLGIGLIMLISGNRWGLTKDEKSLTRGDLKYAAVMVALDILAAILMMNGIKRTVAANASLLGNFEMVATALFAMLIFEENVNWRLWIAIGLVTVASIILTFDSEIWALGGEAFKVSGGSLMVLGATACWGLENNFTRQIAGKNPLQIVTIKGLGVGLGSLVIAFCVGEAMPGLSTLAIIALLGLITYGLSICVYTLAQRHIGAARTSTYYAMAPFFGAALSIIFLGEPITLPLSIAVALMAAGAYLARP